MKGPLGVRASQVLPVHVCSVACTVAVVVVGAVIDKVCGAGGAPPATPVNVSAATLAVSCVVAPDTTVIVTFTVRTPEAATVEIVPLHVDPAVSPD